VCGFPGSLTDALRASIGVSKASSSGRSAYASRETGQQQRTQLEREIERLGLRDVTVAFVMSFDVVVVEVINATTWA
jgi:hypothetical protein